MADTVWDPTQLRERQAVVIRSTTEALPYQVHYGLGDYVYSRGSEGSHVQQRMGVTNRYTNGKLLPPGTRWYDLSTGKIIIEQPPGRQTISYYDTYFSIPTPWVVFFANTLANKLWVWGRPDPLTNLQQRPGAMFPMTNVYEGGRVCGAHIPDDMLDKGPLRQSVEMIAAFWGQPFNNDLTYCARSALWARLGFYTNPEDGVRVADVNDMLSAWEKMDAQQILDPDLWTDVYDVPSLSNLVGHGMEPNALLSAMSTLATAPGYRTSLYS